MCVCVSHQGSCHSQVSESLTCLKSPTASFDDLALNFNFSVKKYVSVTAWFYGQSRVTFCCLEEGHLLLNGSENWKNPRKPVTDLFCCINITSQRCFKSIPVLEKPWAPWNYIFLGGAINMGLHMVLEEKVHAYSQFLCAVSKKQSSCWWKDPHLCRCSKCFPRRNKVSILNCELLQSCKSLFHYILLRKQILWWLNVSKPQKNSFFFQALSTFLVSSAKIV